MRWLVVVALKSWNAREKPRFKSSASYCCFVLKWKFSPKKEKFGVNYWCGLSFTFYLLFVHVYVYCWLYSVNYVYTVEITYKWWLINDDAQWKKCTFYREWRMTTTILLQLCQHFEIDTSYDCYESFQR